MQKRKILSVDDDQNLQIAISLYLKDDGYDVETAPTAQAALAKMGEQNIDVALLDLGLPDSAGITLIPQFGKRFPNAVIIVMSGKAETAEKIACLEIGADDYLTKPFEMRELSARIRAALRRMAIIPSDAVISANTSDVTKDIEKIYFCDEWCLDRTQYQLYTSDGTSANLTIGQFRLLEALILASKRVLSREHLFNLTCEGRFDVYDRAIDIQIARLRRKLKDDTRSSKLIKTVRGVGYMFCGQINQ